MRELFLWDFTRQGRLNWALLGRPHIQRRLISPAGWISVPDAYLHQGTFTEVPPPRCRAQEQQTKAPGSLKDGASGNSSSATGGEAERPRAGGHWKKGTGFVRCTIQLAKNIPLMETDNK